MNLSILSRDELIRYADPQTPLENALLNALKNTDGPSDYCEECLERDSDIEELEEDIQRKDVEIERLEDYVDQLRKKLASAKAATPTPVETPPVPDNVTSIFKE